VPQKKKKKKRKKRNRQKKRKAMCWWLMPVILDTSLTAVQSQAWQIVREFLLPNY
jgi:hypothetical protein